MPHTEVNEAPDKEVATSFFCHPMLKADDLVDLDGDHSSENNGKKKKEITFLTCRLK